MKYSHPSLHFSLGRGVSNPRIVVNIRERGGGRLDLSRLSVRDAPGHWGSEVFNAFMRHLSMTKLKHIVRLDPVDRFFELASLICRYGISAGELWRFFPQEKWPIVCLEPGGSLGVFEWCEVYSNVLFSSPEIIRDELKKAAEQVWITRDQNTGALSQWVGESCLVMNFGDLLPITEGSGICKTPVENTHSVSAIRFLSPPWQGNPPLVQKVMTPAVDEQAKLDVESVIRGVLRRSRKFTDRECRAIIREHYYSFPSVFDFPVPFEQHFAYGRDLINANHPFTQAIVGLLGERMLAEKDKIVCEADLCRFDDAVGAWLSCWDKKPLPMRKWAKHLRKVCRSAREIGLPKVEEVHDNIPSSTAFVPGTVGREASKLRTNFSNINRIIPFGRCLD